MLFFERTFNKMKRKVTRWGSPVTAHNMFAEHISDEELISGIYKQLLQVNNKKMGEICDQTHYQQRYMDGS